LNPNHLTLRDRFLKRGFDIVGSFIGFVFTWWIIIISFVLASIDTRANGIFIQKRVGRNGNIFSFIKIRTMRNDAIFKTNVTTDRDPRITNLGRFLRKTKLDELPQIIHVLIGQMSFVGPRPDVPGFADKLIGKDRIILTVRPGITGPATLKYRNEENLLARHENPELYNQEVIFPDKVRINCEYIENYSFCNDIKYIFQTAIPKKRD
jgi:lipopolysaccharide/colanic/teichoic acid biosynthesis glycosyltransferase